MTLYYAKNPTVLGLSVSAMVWRGHEILLMRRSDNGHWGLPGGFVEVGESVSDAACREVLEETGWSVELGPLIGVYSDPATQVVDYRPSLAEGSLPSLAEGSLPSLAEGSLLSLAEGSSPSLAEGSLLSLAEGSLPSLAEGSLPSLAEGSSPSLADGRSPAESSFGAKCEDAESRPTGASRGRVQIVNLCFRAEAVEQGEPTTPEETLEIGFFAADSLPSPFVPIHTVRIEDGLAGRVEAVVR